MVVAIVGVLAVVAVIAYSKVVRKANSSEVPEMFGELKTREDMYKAENGTYLPLCGTPTTPVTDGKDCTETANDFFPTPLPGKGQRMDPTQNVPARWTALRVHIGHPLYCQYKVVAGLAGDLGPAGPRGTSIFDPANPPPRSWYYNMARCDWDGDPAVNAEYWQRDDLSAIGSENELR